MDVNSDVGFSDKWNDEGYEQFLEGIIPNLKLVLHHFALKMRNGNRLPFTHLRP